MKTPFLWLVAIVALTASLCANGISKIDLLEICSLPGWKGDPVGNVVITTPEGQRHQLTTTRTAQQPKSSQEGMLGWVDCSKQGEPATLKVVKEVPIGSRLILRKPDGSQCTFAAEKPIIEEWGFDPDHVHVIIKSRALHGPAVIERFVIKDGAKNGTCAAYGSPHPVWAKPYLDL